MCPSPPLIAPPGGCPCPPECPCARQCLQIYAPEVDSGRIIACMQGDTGVALMHHNAQLTEALDPPHQYVPWITINGVWQGGNGVPGGAGTPWGPP